MISRRICVVGNTSIETKIFIEEFPPKNCETIIKRMYKTIGGSAACSATVLSRLGFRVCIVTQVAEEEGDELLLALRSAGVNIAHVIRKGPPSLFYSIFDGSFNRNIFIRSTQWDEEAMLSHLHQAIEDAEILILCPTTVSIFTSALEMWKNTGRTIITSPQSAFTEEPPDIISKIFALSDLVFLNETEVCIYTGTSTLQAAVDNLRLNTSQIVIITRGSSGCLVISHQGVIDQPAIKGDVIDPSGAGDSFMAGFLLALEQKQSLKDAAYMGCFAGFAACKVPYLVEEGFLIKDYLKLKGES